MKSAAACVATSVLCLGGLTGFGQTPPQTGQQPPVFRTGIDLVQLDISVLDKNRQPVRGLIGTDFTVLEDGKPQAIAAFSAIDLPDVVTPSTPWMREVAPDVTTNELDNRRVFILVLDDAVAANDPWATTAVIKSATKIIDRMGPNDMASVIFTRDNRNAQELTVDRSRLLKAVNLFPRTGSIDMSGLYESYSIGALERAAGYLEAIPQRRKAIVYLSPGIPIPDPTVRDTFDVNGRLRGAIQNAQRANANFFPIDVCGLTAPGDSRCVHHPDMLMTLAANTGGRAIVNTNEFDSGITQMFRENSSYYLLGYRPTNTATDGTFRRIDVKVSRPDVEVWTRKNYVAPKPASTKEKPRPSSDVQALAEIVPKVDLPLRIAAAPFAVPGKTPMVALTIGLRQPVQAERIVDEVKLLMKAFTPEGAERASETQTIQIAVPPVRRGSEFTRYDVLAEMNLKPGRYALRVSTNSAAAGKDGSVYSYVDVPDFDKAPLSLSGIVLSVTPGVPVAPAEAFKAVMPLIPTTERTFLRVERVAAFVRVYQGGKSPLAPVTFATRILNTQGETSFEKTETLAVDRFSASRAADVSLPMPLIQLSPGEYLLTLDATLQAVTGHRDLRFTVK